MEHYVPKHMNFRRYFSGFVKNFMVFSCRMTPDNYNCCLCFGSFYHSI